MLLSSWRLCQENTCLGLNKLGIDRRDLKKILPNTVSQGNLSYNQDLTSIHHIKQHGSTTKQTAMVIPQFDMIISYYYVVLHIRILNGGPN